MSRNLRLTKEVAAALYKRLTSLPDIVEFCTALNPAEPPPPHTIPILRAIERAALHPAKLLIEMPPAHAKTTTLLKALAWWIFCFPADACAYITYNNHKAHSRGLIVRRYIKKLGIKIDKSNDSKAEWRTMQGGGLLCCGSGGGLNGERIKGLLVWDDPYKNRKEAESPVVRPRIGEFIREVAITRLFQGASAVGMHTRWHPDDTIGEFEKLPDWVRMSFPAIADDGPDVMGRAIGEPLWPELYPLSELNTIRLTLGEWSFASLYQRNPTPRGAQLFGEPTYYDPATFSWNGKRGVIILDPATTESTRADYSAFVVLAMEGYGEQSIGYIVHHEKHQLETPKVAAIALRLQQQYGLLLGVEAFGGFKAVAQVIRNEKPSLRVLEIGGRKQKSKSSDKDPLATHKDDVHTSSGGKFLRAQNASSAWNSGRLRVPRSTEANAAKYAWVIPYLREMMAFTGVGGGEDDSVDATAHGWNVLYLPAPVNNAKGAVERAGA